MSLRSCFRGDLKWKQEEIRVSVTSQVSPLVKGDFRGLVQTNHAPRTGVPEFASRTSFAAFGHCLGASTILSNPRPSLLRVGILHYFSHHWKREGFADLTCNTVKSA
jgi:hypothetical protein